MITFTKTLFFKSAAKVADFPRDSKKHIVFAGRSNVGKSSTINSLINRKNYARVSATPGKTVFVNFFDVDKAFWLVDLPGYGYAKTSDAERKRFSALINDYFSLCKSSIARLYIIVDSRHKPTQDDVMMIDYARNMGINVSVIANKTDKLKKSAVDLSAALISATMGLDEENAPIMFSAEKNFNRDALISDILKSVQD